MIIEVDKIPQDLSNVVLRPADEMECRVSGVSPEAAISGGRDFSIESYEIKIDGEVVCYWGFAVTSFTSSVAHTWLLTCPAMDKYPKLFVKYSRVMTAALLRRFTDILIDVHVDHTAAVRWLKWLGFVTISHNAGFDQMVLRRA